MNGNKISLPRAAVPAPSPVFKHYLEMLKIHLCLYISLSAIFGHVMAEQRFSFNSILSGCFIFFLACGSAITNNIQDREYDSFFVRTCNRSLPQKKVPVFRATVLALLMTGCGLSGLLLILGFLPFFLGVAAVICYNGIYTPLKKKSLLAIIPGSLSGMLPPLIGWTAAGKNLSDPDILMIMTVFALWQIPHFFIILLKSCSHPSKTDRLKRFPCFTDLFSQNEIKLQILIWTSLYSLSMLLFLMNGSMKSHFFTMVSGINAVAITFFISGILFNSRQKNTSFAFAAVNLSMLFFMGAGICDMCF